MSLSLDSFPQWVRERVVSLDVFLKYHVTAGGHEVQSVVDVLCAFLEVRIMNVAIVFYSLSQFAFLLLDP